MSCTILTEVSQAETDLTHCLTDIRVLYVFDDPATVDWGTIAYLNQGLGCRVDLAEFRIRSRFGVRRLDDEKADIHHWVFMIPDGSSGWFDSSGSQLFAERRPDIVIFGESSNAPLWKATRDWFTGLTPLSDIAFNVLKVFSPANDSSSGKRYVVLNPRELIRTHAECLDRIVPRLYPGMTIEDFHPENIMRYEVARSWLAESETAESFVRGIEPSRLRAVIANSLPAGPMRETYLTRVTNYLNRISAAAQSIGKARCDNLIAAYKELRYISEHREVASRIWTRRDVGAYVDDLTSRVERATLAAVGLHWEGRIITRETPNGPVVKFRASVSAEGPQELQLSAITFRPWWDTATIILDSARHIVPPHQSFVREYLVEIDPSRMESTESDSLSFEATISYSDIPLTERVTAPVGVSSQFHVRFEPDFIFVSPSARVEIDKVVSSMNWKVVISKPVGFSGSVDINLAPPSGLFAGAYNKTVDLDEGTTQKVVRIPFSVSNLFELGTQPVTVSLVSGKRTVAVDTSFIRIAECKVSEARTVGFLPDTSGLLEDILRMASIVHQPLTNRSLMTADLDAYKVIIIGSGSFRTHSMLEHVKSRLEEYVRGGGTIVVLGQPEDWPQESLPISIIPASEQIEQADIKSASSSLLLTSPYTITEKELFSQYYKRRAVSGALVTPSQAIFRTTAGSVLLSQSTLGSGRIYYCGLPLLEMVSRLQIEAIHLFANLLNN
jgi:hypothetical protein